MLFDIAINKTAEQSSAFEKNVAAAAADSNRGTDLIDDICAHTYSNDTNPWWMVDLQALITSLLSEYSTGEWSSLESVGKQKQLLFKILEIPLINY